MIRVFTPANATRAIFFVSGFGSATWAPLVPFFKNRLDIGEDVLGFLIVCIGIGALSSSLFAGSIAARFGCRRVIVASTILEILALFILSRVDSIPFAILSLIFFGAAAGFLDVTMNLHAVLVEQKSRRQIMSGMHAMWSVGGFIGALAFSFWLMHGFSSEATTLIEMATMGILLGIFFRALYPTGGKSEGKAFAIPRGIVKFIAIIMLIAFLAEGSIMDWGAVFLTSEKSIPIEQSGMAFAIFSAAMFVMRVIGDSIVARLGGKIVVILGCIIELAGFLLVIFSPNILLMYLGFFAIGFGSSNVVPVMYSMLGRQKVMPVNLAVAATSMIGYFGMLAGPSSIGFIAKATSLTSAFILLSILVFIELLVARYIYSRENSM